MTRRPSQADLERVVGHFLYYLSNEDDKHGCSQRQRLYGQLPIESKMLFPDVDDEIILHNVKRELERLQKQKDILPPIHGKWRSYS